MSETLEFDIRRQPDDTTCGPTCLHAIYRFYDDRLPLDQLLGEVPRLDEGGTLAVMLGCHALQRGYRARLLTYNLEVFDPTWFAAGAPPLAERLTAQLAVKSDPKVHVASQASLRFLELGGDIAMRDLTPELLRRPLKAGIPILTGLSATFLYQSVREDAEGREDDLAGRSMGHFVVLCGYDVESRSIVVADPYHPNPVAETAKYSVGVERVITSILLGVLTYDANLLIIEPGRAAPAAGAPAAPPPAPDHR